MAKTYKRVPAVCEMCGKDFLSYAHNIKAGQGKTCSRACVIEKVRRCNRKHGMFVDGRAHGAAKRGQNAVRRALLKGTLKKTASADCGAAKVEAHHDDYGKPLDVVWLCFGCHRARHAAIRKAS